MLLSNLDVAQLVVQERMKDTMRTVERESMLRTGAPRKRSRWWQSLLKVVSRITVKGREARQSVVQTAPSRQEYGGQAPHLRNAREIMGTEGRLRGVTQ